jgi:hypothetical protein
MEGRPLAINKSEVTAEYKDENGHDYMISASSEKNCSTIFAWLHKKCWILEACAIYKRFIME